MSDHTLDINIRRCNYEKFNFSEIEEYVRELTGSREYQYDAIKRIMIYLWGGAYKSVVELAEENYRQKPQIPQRFGNKDIFHAPPARYPTDCPAWCIWPLEQASLMSCLPWPIFPWSWDLSVGSWSWDRPSTIIEQGLREKFKELMNRQNTQSTSSPKIQGKSHPPAHR